MQPWFPDAKLGIFIHWGIYAVDGIDESWAFFNGHVTHEEYMRQLNGFTASRWEPSEWAELFKRSGAQYAVLTTKHHDGVALWPTRQSALNVVESTPAARDLIGPYVEAMRKTGLKVGFYFSHLDWSHPDYASIGTEDPNANAFAFKRGTTDWEAWERFLTFHRAQIDELCTDFGPIDLLWFDGDWERDADTWRMAELRDRIHKMQPNVVINSRMQGHGDYATPEQGLPIEPPAGPWEFCMTINNSWGYQGRDTEYKSPRQVLRTLCEVVALGGNLLLDVGPKEDGTIPQEQVAVLEYLGSWLSKHSDAVYGTVRGLPPGYFYGPSTQKGNKLYLFVFGNPREVMVRGLKSEVKSARLLGSGEELSPQRLGGAGWLAIPAVLWFDLDGSELEADVSVVELELKGDCVVLFSDV